MRALHWASRALAVAALFLAGCRGEGGSIEIDCVAGERGCSCAEGGVCATGDDGTALVCSDNVCEDQSCAGQTGCVCLGGRDCGDERDACTGGVCRPRDCAAGEFGCECLAGTCGEGLHCNEAVGGGTCVENTGFPGGPCLDNGLCREQSRCDAIAGVCVFCERGSQGCIPRDDGTCFAGLLFGAGRCVPPGPPPLGSACHTPCTGDLIAQEGGDEIRRECRPNGYMDGCVSGTECVEGTCVEPGTTPSLCAGEGDCANHQTCIAGRCASNCDETTSCPVGLSCHDYVCRVPCEVSVNEAINGCPDGYFCDTVDGRSGICEPRLSGRAMGSETGEVEAAITLSEPSIQLTPSLREGRVRVAIESDEEQVIRITKLAHRIFDPAGTLVLDTAAEERDAALVEGSGGFSARMTPEPLIFATVRVGAEVGEGRDLDVTVPEGGGELDIEVEFGDLPTDAARIEGDLLISSPEIGERTLTVTYSENAGGQWAGQMYYFAVFPDEGVDAWVADRDGADILTVKNAYVRRLNAYRRGALFSVNELRAVIDATRSGSWERDSVVDACDARDGACYLFDSGTPGDDGIREFTSQLSDAPIPSGATEFPVALRLEPHPSDPNRVVGVVDSNITLHYPGFPSVELTFENAPADPASCSAGGRECPVFMSDMQLDAFIGGRVDREPVGGCDRTGFEPIDVPWLLPGALSTRALTSIDGIPARPSCRESRAPLIAVAEGSGLTPAEANINLAGGNPLSTGRSVRRSIRLIDGVMVDQRTMVITFEERFQSFIGDGVLSSYGVMELRRGEPSPESPMPTSAAIADVPEAPFENEGATCNQDLLTSLGIGSLNRSSALLAADGILSGILPVGEESYPPGVVHYLCAETGLFDGGPGNRGQAGLDELASCPAGSNVTFFAFPEGSFSQADIADLDCQRDGTCNLQLAVWSESSFVADGLLHLEPSFACDGRCTDNRFDLREGKIFSRPGVTVYPPLETRVRDAFRYKTRFQSSTGRNLGFAPRECAIEAGQNPYCFDSEEIAELRDAVDCLHTIYQGFGDPDDPAWDDVRSAVSFSLTSMADVGPITPGSVDADGFERLYAELLVTLGDEAFTQALRSRFDLAASRTGAFVGEQLEFDGPNLSGIAGFELSSLYQAAQFHGLATERFYEIVAPLIRTALEREDVGDVGIDVVTQSLASTYLERIVGAATKKARAWAEIARRYQAIDRSDIAQRVIEREFASTYLESVLLSSVMTAMVDATPGSDRDQVRVVLESAQRNYTQALAELREVYAALGEATDHFGFAPDFLPLPALDANDANVSNGFESALRIARLRAADAATFEEVAIRRSGEHERSFESFLQELITLRRTYERTLREICGSFEGDDGRVYPAISEFAELNEEAAEFADPCGLLGTGAIAEKILEMNTLNAAGRTLRERATHKIEEINAEVRRAQRQCDRIESFADYRLTRGEEIVDLNQEIRNLQLGVSAIDRTLEVANTSVMVSGVEKLSLPAYITAAGLANAGALVLQGFANARERDIERVQLDIDVAAANQECVALQIDHEFTMLRLTQELDVIQLDMLQHLRETEQRRAELERLYLEAQSVLQEQREAEQLRINSEAAFQDPNRRIYRNAAVYNADISFESAVRNAYRATLMLEYFMGRSYEGRGELFLVRLVQNGFYNLTIYLNELEDTYEEFREEFGVRAVRVERLSLRDDLLPLHAAENGIALTRTEERQSLFDMISDPVFINADGQLEFDFRTSLEDLSPCTFNHQIDHIETVMVGGSSPGSDQEADLLVWQEGTGTIIDELGDSIFYRLPERLSVSNPRFDGATFYDPIVYRRFEMRQRPYINSNWRLILDQRNNPENADIDLRTLEDIHLYIYYTDFTNPENCQ
ncbi:MAG: hypothetical protein AAF411_00550 [Myxococcota bacterium]